ncbi:triose-phosphate isomerase [Pelagibacterales bacterium SAG-MED31]|nr:triose-phosphate isomerase [Pelagibacterales bacterium SAG-MED31]
MIKLDDFSSFFVANWKLNGNFQFIDQFISNISLPKDKSRCVVICPTSIHLNYISNKKNGFYLGAQNISEHKDGAFTGEISANSLSELDVNFCLVGHSERRKIFYEKNKEINFKSANLINNNLIPIICVGETLEEKEKGLTKSILEDQLKNCIPNSSNFKNTIIAYEPVWAIGTGLTPTSEEIDDTHNFIRSHVDKFNKYKILYGGSVKGNNAKEITNLPNVDGALIGGASLILEEFTKIIKD